MKRRESFSWHNPKLVVRDTGRYGRGIYARQTIEQNEVLFVMGGQVLTREEEHRLSPALRVYPVEISEDFALGPRRLKDLPKMPQHYVNHSCEPNTGFRGQLMLVAMRAIAHGEEIVCDYAMCLRPAPLDTFTLQCQCGSSRCRGMVTCHDWKLPEVQRRYKGYFQPYLQAKIAKNKRHRMSRSRHQNRTH